MTEHAPRPLTVREGTALLGLGLGLVVTTATLGLFGYLTEWPSEGTQDLLQNATKVSAVLTLVSVGYMGKRFFWDRG